MKLLMFGISSKYGGTEAVIYSMLEEFRMHNLDFDFINTFNESLAKEDWLKSFGCHVFQLNLRKRGRYFKQRKELRSFFKTISKTYDGVWINIQEPEGADILKRAKKSGMKNRIVVGHSSQKCDESDFIRRFMIKVSRHSIVHNASKLIAVSHLAKSFSFGPKANALIIHSGIDTNRYQFNETDRGEIRKQYNVRPTDPLLICVGRLTRQKNIDYSIRILEKLLTSAPDTKLFIVGDGEERLRLVKIAEQKGLQESVFFLGIIANIPAYLSAADYFIFPSTAEGLGMVLIEAQCSGLPCIASDGPIPKEAKVTDLVTWLPLSDGPEKWAETILATPINKNREGYDKKLQELGLDYQTVAQKYLSLLTE